MRACSGLPQPIWRSPARNLACATSVVSSAKASTLKHSSILIIDVVLRVRQRSLASSTLRPIKPGRTLRFAHAASVVSKRSRNVALNSSPGSRSPVSAPRGQTNRNSYWPSTRAIDHAFMMAPIRAPTPSKRLATTIKRDPIAREGGEPSRLIGPGSKASASPRGEVSTDGRFGGGRRIDQHWIRAPVNVEETRTAGRRPRIS